MKAVLREISPDVLGVDFGAQRCDAETVDKDALDAAEHGYVKGADRSADGGASARTPVRLALGSENGSAG